MEVNSEQFVLNTLTGDAFVLVNKKLLRYLKGDGSAAIFLGELISAYKYHLGNQSLEPDNTFPCPIKRFEVSIGLSEYKQRHILDRLSLAGICKVFLHGFPASKYVCLDFDKLAKILSADTLSSKKLEQQEFYNNLNIIFNISLTDRNENWREEREKCLDNIGNSLRGTLILMSDYFSKLGLTVNWTPKQLGQIRNWVNKRSTGKPFDFTIVTRTLSSLKTTKDISFDLFVRNYIDTARMVQDVHYNSQVLDYNELLDTKIKEE